MGGGAARVMGWASRREVANEPPPAKGGFASRPMVARLVRYGPVRQRKLFYGKGVLSASQVKSLHKQQTTYYGKPIEGALEARLDLT